MLMTIICTYVCIYVYVSCVYMYIYVCITYVNTLTLTVHMHYFPRVADRKFEHEIDTSKQIFISVICYIRTNEIFNNKTL